MNYCKCVNYITLFVISLINIVCGFLIMILDTIVVADGHRFKIVFHLNSISLLIVTFIGSLLMFILGIYGCYLTFRQGYHTIPLIIYGTIVLCLAIGELGTGIRIFTLRSGREKELIEHFEKALQNFHNDEDYFKKFVNYIHRKLQCCGMDNHIDWVGKYSKKRPPESCCKTNKNCDTTIYENINHVGCRDIYIIHYRAIAANCGFAILNFSIFHIFCAIVGFTLAYKQKNYQHRQVMDIYSTTTTNYQSPYYN
ncbi:UNVERIFIED_CONTAM: hypothetical protein RMT77_009238 [Armadillidium vulgare]